VESESEREREQARGRGDQRRECCGVCVCVRASSLAWLCAVSRSLSSTFVPAELHCGAAVTRLLIGICPDLQICAFTASETRVCASCTEGKKLWSRFFPLEVWKSAVRGIGPVSVTYSSAFRKLFFGCCSQWLPLMPHRLLRKW
jgi:hypothetical protein